MADDQPATDSTPDPTAPEPEVAAPAEPSGADPGTEAARSAGADSEAPAVADPGGSASAERELSGSGVTGLAEAEPTGSAESSAGISRSADPDPAAATEPGTEDSSTGEREPMVAAEPGAEPSDATGADSPSPAESGADKPSTLAATGTTPAWWAWVSRRRRSVALVAGLVVVAVVATVVTVVVTTAGPRDVVQSYMDAIHAGDVDAALEIAGEPEDDGRLAFLSADAIADDWSVGAIVERHRRDDEADVDVTITAGDSSQQGRFHVVKGDDGWTIEAPFVDVELQVAGVSTVELGDVEQAVDAVEVGSTVPLRVFPGVYELYPGLAKQVSFDPGVLIAAPVPSADRKLRFAAGYTLTRDGAAFANGAIAKRVMECESETTISPDGCPFSGEDERALRAFSSIRNVSWAVTRMPDAEFVPDVTGLRMVVREPGLVTLSGSGFSYESDSDEAQPFSVTCEFGVDNLAVAVAKDGLAVNGAVGRPYAAVEATHCF